MGPFEEATRIMSSQTYVSMSKVIPMVRLLTRTLEESTEEIDRFVCLQLLKDDLKVNLEQRFADVERSSIKVLATYLDPRYVKQIKILFSFSTSLKITFSIESI